MVNIGDRCEYAPFQKNVFSHQTPPFEGYAQIRNDSSCGKDKLRVDAAFVTLSSLAGSGATDIKYKSNVTAPAAVTGY